MPRWSSGYDTRPECERPGFDPLLRHWIFWSVRTHYYIWHPFRIHQLIVCLVRSVRTHFPQSGWMSWQMPWWSSGFDALLKCKRLRFFPPFRYWIFQSFGTHCCINATNNARSLENPYLLTTIIAGFQIEVGFKTTKVLFISGLYHSRLLSCHSYKSFFFTKHICLTILYALDQSVFLNMSVIYTKLSFGIDFGDRELKKY